MKKKMGCWYMLLLAIVFEVTGTSSMKFFSVQGGLEGYHESMPPTKLLALIVILVGLVMIKKGTVRMTTGEYIHDN